MKKTFQSPTHEPTHEEIAILAQQIYEEEGCPWGRAEAHWLEAERQLLQQTARQRRRSVLTEPEKERLIPA